MTKAEELFHIIAAELPDTKESKMFGALCIKAPNGKAGVMLHKGNMVFKLNGDAVETAMKLMDAKAFEPMAGRPMNGWIQLSEIHSSEWKKYAEIAMEYVKMIETIKKIKKK